MSGSNDHGQLQLVAPNAAGFIGGTIGRTIEGTVSGTNAFDGDLTLTQTNTATLQKVAVSRTCP
jgi:hypothetical protein